MARAIIKPELQLQRVEQLRQQMNHFKAQGALMFKVPVEKAWSGIEVVQHMNIAYDVYQPKIDNALKQLKEQNETLDEIKAKSIPSFLINRFPPQEEGKIKFKMKTFKKFKPVMDMKSFKEEDANPIYSEFERGLDHMIQSIESYRTKDVKSKRFNSAIGASVRFNAAEALEFCIAHAERHCKQVENTLKKVS